MKLFHYVWGCWVLCWAWAAQAAQEDTLYRLRQDAAVQQYQQEQPLREEALSAPQSASAPEDGMMALLHAVNAQNEGEIRRLLALYRQQADADPDMVLFAEANLAIAGNDMRRAIALYRELYARNPQFVRGRLDLARLLFVDKQNREAAALFDHLTVPGQPVVNEKIRQFSHALAQRSAWQGSVAVGVLHGRNLNQSSEETVLRPQQECQTDANGVPIVDADGRLQCHTVYLPATAPEALQDHGLLYEAALNKQWALHGNHALQWQSQAFGRMYRRHTPFNEHYLSAGLGYLYQNRTQSISVAPLYQATVSGRHLQYSSSGVYAYWQREFGPHAFVGVQAEYKRDRYRAAEHRHFDGPQTAVFATAAYTLPRQTTVFGGYDYLRKKSREAVDSYRRHGLRAGVNKIFSWGLDATLQASWRRASYDAEHAWLQTRRRDHTLVYQLDLKPVRKQPGGWLPVLSLRQTHNRSSSWVNRYRARELALKLNYAF